MSHRVQPEHAMWRQALGWVVLAAVLAGPTPVIADTLTGRTVEAGNSLAGVEILVIDPASRVILGQDISGPDGSFSVSYRGHFIDLGAFKSDYARVWKKGIRPRDGDPPLSIELTPSAFVEGAPPPDGGDCD